LKYKAVVPRVLTEVERAAGLESAVALERSRSMLQGVLSHTDILLYAKDLDGRFILTNEALDRVLDASAGSIVGQTDYDLMPAEAADEFRRQDREIAGGGDRDVRPARMQHPDGTWHDYLSTKFPLLDTGGRICAVAGLMTDVTELADQRRELAEAEERWRRLVESSPVAVAVIGVDAIFAYANPEAMRLYGVPSEPSIVGHPATEFVPPTDLQGTRDLFGSVLRGKAVHGQHWSLLRADGRLVSVEINAAAVVYRGRPAIQVELRDRTDQVAAETALRESESRWRSLVAASPIGIGLCDEHGCFVTANDALCLLLGRSSSEVIGHHHEEFGSQEDPGDLDPPPLDNGLAPVSPRAALQADRPFSRPDGEVRWGSQTLTQVPGPKGEPWTLAHIEDITERRAAVRATIASEANLTAVAKVIKQIQSGGDARQTIVDATLQLAHATTVGLVEAHPDGTALVQTTATDPDLVGMQVTWDAGSATVEAFATGRPIFYPDAVLLPLVAPATRAPGGAHSIYLVPVRSGDVVTAVLVVGWAQRVSSLDDRRIGVVRLLADQAGVALRQSALLAELEALAVTDPLTALPNRRGWDQRLTTVLATAARTRLPLTIAIADLDHFKRFNDAHGHPAGDVLLRQFADAGRAALRVGDTMARWGGEEFAMALPDCNATAARTALQRVLRASPEPETCSIGFATWDGSESGADLVARADRALYAAKRAGRNQISPAA
jgi:diguanylate cyclase (GGDEF)-like protein/PAS domain S-box-containing protein